MNPVTPTALFLAVAVGAWFAVWSGPETPDGENYRGP